MLCTTKKFVKSGSTQIASKYCLDGISQPIKWEIFSVLPILFPLLMWCFQLTPVIWCCPFHHGLGTRADHTMHRNLSVHIFFPQSLVCIFLTRLITWELTFIFSLQHSMVIWNDWKQKSSCQEVTHKSGNSTEHYNLSTGLKHKCELAVAQPTPHTRTRHTPTNEIKNKQFLLGGLGGGGGGESTVIWSWA